ncbi:hypothetical protein [Oryzicola mucosus]|uniref:Uncharacterized protein n=1 Tax=Oryzicola mucosus TaxID=2767425 RepID=A0A8J6TYK8_9HYPH|nr:hypothetical protein [Oryzicola mucosus]MBD0414879.1 hypothetical protein [Oryzicola mucosus]
MAFEDIKAELALLMQEMVNQPEDIRELEEQVRAKLIELRAQGLPLPADLVELERRLDADLDAEVEDDAPAAEI